MPDGDVPPPEIIPDTYFTDKHDDEDDNTEDSSEDEYDMPPERISRIQPSTQPNNNHTTHPGFAGTKRRCEDYHEGSDADGEKEDEQDASSTKCEAKLATKLLNSERTHRPTRRPHRHHQIRRNDSIRMHLPVT